MTTRDYRSTSAMSISLNNFEQSQSFDQRAARLRACIIAAKRRNDTAQLVVLREQFEAMKAELAEMELQDVAADLAAAAHEAGDIRNERALNKAAYHLASGMQPVEVLPGQYLIRSANRSDIIHRYSHARGCSCEASVKGFPCWHASAVEIIEAARSTTITATA